jgi:hypothetical protein
MSSSERLMVSASPLDDAGILRHVLNNLGPGHHLFISAVSKAWRETYERISSIQMAGFEEDFDDEAVLHTITPKTTLYSAVFASASRVNLAHESG